MSLVILTRSPSPRLVTLATALTVLRLQSTVSAIVDFFLGAASEGVEQVIGRYLSRQVYQESLAGEDYPSIRLSQRPVDRDSITVILNDVELDSDDYVFEPPGLLWRRQLWPRGSARFIEAPELNIQVTYAGGYITPGIISTWTAAHAYALGAWVRPSSPLLTPYLMECTTAGTSGSTEPTWGNTSAAAVADGTGSLIWTVRDAQELPADYQRVALAAANHFYRKSGFSDDLKRIDAENFTATFEVAAAAMGGGALPEFLMRALKNRRLE